MMTNLATPSGFDADAYLAWEEQQPEKHEHRPELGDCRFPALGVSIPFHEIFENVGPDDSGLASSPSGGASDRTGALAGALGVPPFHTWAFPDGTLWTEFHRADGGYLLRFPQLADFLVSADACTVTCIPVPEVPEGTARHLYLNQVLPLVLSKLGKLVFHASAVEIGSHAVAFVGESGRGKSTLAASFAVSGCRFLTDDGLVVEPRYRGASRRCPAIRPSACGTTARRR
jgi:hypothetical protein